MRSRTSAAAHVGRIGALAVALGVGAAVTLGYGVAAADSSDASGSSSGSSSSESSSQASPSKESSTEASETDREAATSDDDDQADEQTDADDEALDDSGSDEPAEDGPAEEEPTDEPQLDDETETTPDTPRPSAPSNRGDDDDPIEESIEDTAVIDTGVEVAVEEPRAIETPAEPVADAPAETVPDPADDVVNADAPLPSVAPTPAAAVAPSARSLPSAPPNLPKAFSGLLAAVGLAPLIANLPAAPAPPPALWALLASARREFERASTRPVTTAPAQSNIVAAAVVTPYPTLPSVNKGWVTGKVPNNFGIGGTDLGIMWDGGIRLGERFVHVAFGDTFANANMTGDWRSNVLLISTDNNLTNGLQLVQTGYAGRFIGPFKGRLGLFGSEVTQIPTSGIQIDGKQFVNFMSVKSWDTPGRWTTNYSAISVYDQSQDKWVLAPSTIRSAGWFRSSTRYVAGSQNFQQAAYVLQPEAQVGEDGVRYLYAFGTPSGRAGSAYVSRVAEGSVTDLSKYEYWDGSKWVRNRPAVAAPIIGDSKRSTGLFGFVVDWANDPNVFGGYLGGLFGAKTGGNVSEMSVQYNEYLGKYVVLYGDGNNNIRLRTADTPEGPWSAPVTVATSKQYPDLYAPMIHPWSGTGDLKDENDEPDLNNLYWNMSLWSDYNVVLMQTNLSPLKAVYV